MKREKSHQVAGLILTALMMFGCSAKDTSSIVKNPAISKSKSKKTTGVQLSTLKNSGTRTLALKAKKTYVQNEAIRFIVDTGKAEGYLYIIYLDNNGETGLLYPNAQSPLSEMSGQFIFPRDFGNMNIRATKDCKGCSEEQTTIYALLSKSPILDINTITKTDLLNFVSPPKTRGLSLELNGGNKRGTNLYVGRVDFLVK
jgi:hypothetical protein